MSAYGEKNILAVECLNAFMRTLAWCDFTVFSLSGDRLVVEGGIDVFCRADVRLTFSGIHHLDVHMDWRTDTKEDSFSLVAGDESKRLNQLYEIEAGNSLFKIQSEYFKRPFFIAAQSVDLEILKAEQTAA